MRYSENASIIIEEKIADGYGGYTVEEKVLCDIKCLTAPYRVEVGEITLVPNPLSSVKFFTKSIDFDEDTFFYIVHNDKKYKKVSITNYGKCVLIVGERICD